MRQVKMTRDSFHVFQANARNALAAERARCDPDLPIQAPAPDAAFAGGRLTKICDNWKTEVKTGVCRSTRASKHRHGSAGEEPPQR
ncbi:MAG: hypothetical protein ACLT1A_09605 [Dysosmobacter sp.]